MNRSQLSILFLGKANDPHCSVALQFCRSNYAAVQSFLGEWGDSLPDAIGRWEGDYIISYLSRWVLPPRVLKRARRAAINFHPASPDYPGFGGNNFALYEEAKEFGVTCHHMAPQVDTGPIIAVKTFPVFSTDGVESLLQRTYDHQLTLFYEVTSAILNGSQLPSSNRTWTRKPFTKKQLDELEKIDIHMTREEVRKRIRSATFKKWRPRIEFHGFVFELIAHGDRTAS